MRYYLLPKLVFFAIYVLCFTSCREEQIMSGFHGEGKLYLEVIKSLRDEVGALYIDNDSAHYRFAYQPQIIAHDTVLLAIKLMGDAADFDRSFMLKIDEQASTALPVEYSLPNNLVMPAGHFVVHVPLLIRRSSRLRDEEATLKIKLVSTVDFRIEDVNPDRDGQRTTFRIHWSDILSRPAWWVGNFENFGSYSRTKHKFILEVFEVSPTRFENVYEVDEFGWITEVNDPQLSVAISLNHNMLNRRLDQYNLQHPDNPLRNDSGDLIRFCATCD